MKVLFVYQVAKLGDVLMTTPSVYALKKRMPDCQITFCVPSVFHCLFQEADAIHQLWHAPLRPRGWRAVRFISALRREGFHAVVLAVHNSSTYTAITALARVKVRAGSADSNRYYASLLTHNLGLEPWTHTCYHYCEYIAAITQQISSSPLTLGPIEITIPLKSHVEAQRLLGSLYQQGSYFCLHPGTGGSSHPWYAEQYGRVARWLQQMTGFHVVVTGTDSEREQSRIVCSIVGEKCINLAGQTDVATLGAIYQNATLLISGDTGSVHIAAALNLPCVVVHTVSDYHNRIRLSRPWQSPYRAVFPVSFCRGCSPIVCHRKGEDCLRSISAEAVVEAALELLAEHGCAREGRRNLRR